jgi:HNH endonuclease
MGRINYRAIYKNHFGPIPKDAQGRSYDIHHIDGDRNNNDPINLVAVSLEDHLKIHLDQGDIAAAAAIQLRFNSSEYNNILRENGRRAGNLAKKRKTGPFALSSHERKELSRKTGFRSKSDGFGLFARDAHKRKSDAKNAGLNARNKKAGFHDPSKNGYNFVRNTKWYNDGKNNFRLSTPPIGEEWNEGMIKNAKSNIKSAYDPD